MNQQNDNVAKERSTDQWKKYYSAWKKNIIIIKNFLHELQWHSSYLHVFALLEEFIPFKTNSQMFRAWNISKYYVSYVLYYIVWR